MGVVASVEAAYKFHIIYNNVKIKLAPTKKINTFMAYPYYMLMTYPYYMLMTYPYYMLMTYPYYMLMTKSCITGQ